MEISRFESKALLAGVRPDLERFWISKQGGTEVAFGPVRQNGCDITLDLGRKLTCAPDIGTGRYPDQQSEIAPEFPGNLDRGLVGDDQGQGSRDTEELGTQSEERPALLLARDVLSAGRGWSEHRVPHPDVRHFHVSWPVAEQRLLLGDQQKPGRHVHA